MEAAERAVPLVAGKVAARVVEVMVVAALEVVGLAAVRVVRRAEAGALAAQVVAEEVRVVKVARAVARAEEARAGLAAVQAVISGRAARGGV